MANALFPYIALFYSTQAYMTCLIHLSAFYVQGYYGMQTGVNREQTTSFLTSE